MPQPVRDSVTNFFSNIGDVYIAANNLLQLKITDGVSDIMRVVINTVFGVGGLFDVATLAKLPKHDNDLGLTLGHYGVPSGPYLVLPLFGPSTVRDAVGSVGNYYVNPLSYVHPDRSELGAVRPEHRQHARESARRERCAGRRRARQIFVRAQCVSAAPPVSAVGRRAVAALPNYGDEAPLPKYDDVDSGAAAGRRGRRRRRRRRTRLPLRAAHRRTAAPAHGGCRAGSGIRQRRKRRRRSERRPGNDADPGRPDWCRPRVSTFRRFKLR